MADSATSFTTSACRPPSQTRLEVTKRCAKSDTYCSTMLAQGPKPCPTQMGVKVSVTLKARHVAPSPRTPCTTSLAQPSHRPSSYRRKGFPECVPAICFQIQDLEGIPKFLLVVISHMSAHLWSRILYVFLVSFFLCQAELLTPSRNCSVNTELIYRVNDSEQELCVWTIRIEVYGVSAILSSQNSTTQSTDALEYWMTGFLESFQDLCGGGIPFSFSCGRKSSIPTSFPLEDPETSSVRARISSRNP